VKRFVYRHADHVRLSEGHDNDYIRRIKKRQCDPADEDQCKVVNRKIIDDRTKIVSR